ncbi:flagellar export chaperone FliS [Candidatus Contubernalis alkaliaceticus]|uniref:flagellar export chaperone FliS n=1 Tax=Candidatus Contubernalis alkaliaceticus TaxID=338645 RepID=UPI001F4C4C99|nr:flagellar export chaperone FliS [Candidatus Contubernalis alkalaceticus]
MMLANPYQKYQHNQVETSTPGKLLLMLYNGALKFIREARKAAEEKNIEKVNNKIGRAQDIIFELMSSLNFEQGKIAENLYALYDYMNQRLIEANIKKDDKILAEVEGMLESLRDTWKEAILNNN